MLDDIAFSVFNLSIIEVILLLEISSQIFFQITKQAFKSNFMLKSGLIIGARGLTTVFATALFGYISDRFKIKNILMFITLICFTPFIVLGAGSVK